MIAFYLPGNLPVYTFSLLLGLGATTGLAWAIWRQNERRAAYLITAGLSSLAGALIGGRAVYILLKWPYYQSHLAESFQFHLGGLSWPGALIGALLFLAGYAWVNHLPFGPLADSLVPLFMLISLAAWIGCWLDGCAYGPESLAWWSLPAQDEWGVLNWRFPTQPLAAFLTLTLFWLVDRWHPGRRIPGLTASLAVIGLMAIILATSFLRADPGLVWNGLRLEAWTALGIGLFSGLLAAILAWL